MVTIGIVFLLICVMQLLLIIAFRQPKALIKSKIIGKSTLYPAKVILFVGIGILYVVLFTQLGKYHTPQPLVNKPYVVSAAVPTLTPGTVRTLGARKTSTILNLYFLYLGTNKSETTLATTALALRQQYCSGLCIVNLYDEKLAFETDMQRVQITSDAVMKQWNVKNYVYVADHYLGYLDAVNNAQFAYYPFHDGYYKHAKAGDLKNY